MGGLRFSGKVRWSSRASNAATVTRLAGRADCAAPNLDRVATRMTHDQLVRQVIQGGGNMPAYGKNLNPAEVTALVSFLETLHPANQSPARDAAAQAASAPAPQSQPVGEKQ